MSAAEIGEQSGIYWLEDDGTGTVGWKQLPKQCVASVSLALVLGGSLVRPHPNLPKPPHKANVPKHTDTPLCSPAVVLAVWLPPGAGSPTAAREP